MEINYRSEDLPEVLGDYDRLQQVFINIIHNAIKYSNPGDIIDVVSTLEDRHEDRSRAPGEGGSGLGLYIVKQIVEKHDGQIQIESQVGEGTNIIVTLPILEELIYGGDKDETL
ncbi:MAG: two-component system, OmpR family, sensor histidine kinase VicK [Eubacteriaceae bacterium]|nr:two-component system, OmpR family, sensor histidine kinase VicK [Eubacteriaceae bacterium]